MKSSHELVALLALVTAVAAPMCSAASVGDYPNKPIHLVIPYPPGGSADLIGRMVADKLAKTIGQAVIVDNKGGATGAIGSQFVAQADPDGYTLLVAIADTHAINPAVIPKLSYDPVKDFVPISLMATQPLLLAVGPSMKAANVTEFVAAAKAKPGAITYASNGTGGLQHLAMELFSNAAGIKTLHVPYKGAGPAMSDILGGQVDAIFIQRARRRRQSAQRQPATAGHRVGASPVDRPGHSHVRRIGLSEVSGHAVVRTSGAERHAARDRGEIESAGQDGTEHAGRFR